MAGTPTTCGASSRSGQRQACAHPCGLLFTCSFNRNSVNCLVKLKSIETHKILGELKYQHTRWGSIVQAKQHQHTSTKPHGEWPTQVVWQRACRQDMSMASPTHAAHGPSAARHAHAAPHRHSVCGFMSDPPRALRRSEPQWQQRIEHLGDTPCILTEHDGQ